MRRSIWLLAGICLFVAGSAVAIRKVGVMANQPLTAESPLVTLDPLEKTDQNASPDCAHLTRLAMQAEVNALGVQVSSQSQPESLTTNIADLQESVNQLRSFGFASPQIDQLRDEYTAQLKKLLQSLESPHIAPIAQAKVDQRVAQVTQFYQEKILFGSCQLS